MGYPVEMIGKDTRLFGIIGSSAIEHKLEECFNHYFKQIDVDCKAMPLNIREDDIGFFFNGLKDSKITGVYLEEEYQQTTYNLFKPDDDELSFVKACDTVEIIEGEYSFSMTYGRALISLLDKTVKSSSLMIIGNTPQAKSFLFHAIQAEPEKILFASPYIEEMLDMMAFVPETIAHDIFRINNDKLNIAVDIVINFTNNTVLTNSKETIHVNNDFEKIVDKIAKIKTKEWSQNG